MAWKATDMSKERVKFVLEWEQRWNEGQGRANVAELCRFFGISRETGYRWINRYRHNGHRVEAVQEHSRRPKNSPNAIPDEVADVIVAARKAHPRWGPKKLHAWLRDLNPGRVIPSPSGMALVLKRRGLTVPRKPGRRRAPPRTEPFATATQPNSTWCIDFKGKFRLQNGQYCHVLTLVDAFSRFLLRAEALADPDGQKVQRVLDSAFQEFGLPQAMRSDNGPPFASTGAGGLTKLSLWWLKLGIRLERIDPGKPQQNGRQERVHLTFEEVSSTPAKDLKIQQRSIDVWRREYNEERPHEALGMQPPARLYSPSSRYYPRKLMRPEFNPHSQQHLDVDRDGYVRWEGRKVFISTALAHELIELVPDGLYIWKVMYGPLLLGTLDDRKPDKGLSIPRRKRGTPSWMSLT